MISQKRPRGCDACRGSHLKCDQQQPKCGRCISRGTDCTGYQEGFDVFRDQTDRVLDRERLRAQKRQRSALTQSPPAALSTPVLNRALQAYYVDYVPTPDKNGTVHKGYFDIVMQLSAGAGAQMAIASAMPWLSLHLIGSKAPSDVLRQKQLLLSKTLKALRTDLDNASAATQDHILATILVLENGTAIDHICDPHRTPDTHLRGALALINRRPLESWNTTIGQRFLMWMRRSAILHAIRTRDLSVMLHDDIEDQLSEILVRSPATVLDSYASRLVKLRAVLESGNVHTATTVSRLISLKEDLDLWPHRLPPHWTMNRVHNAPDEDFWGLRQTLFCSIHVAWFYTTCNALKIGVIALLLKHLSDEQLSAYDCAFRIALKDEARQEFHDLCTAKPFMVGRLRHAGEQSIDAYDIAFGPSMGLHRLGSWFFMHVVDILYAVWDLNEETCPPALRGVLPTEQVVWLQKQMRATQMIFSQFYGSSVDSVFE